MIQFTALIPEGALIRDGALITITPSIVTI